MAHVEAAPSQGTVVLAGAGIQRGSVYGRSDRDGAHPADKAITPADLAATIMHLLGVPADFEITDRTNRPLAALQGRVIEELLA